MPLRRVAADHDPAKGTEEVVVGPMQETSCRIEDFGEQVVDLNKPVSLNPSNLEPDSNQSRKSYQPYKRKLKEDRTMPHKPKLKLDEDPRKVTEVTMCPVQEPRTLVCNYPMKSKEHGVALIINNKKFAADRHKTRNGTERDEENLVETFRFLGYRVEIRRDCTKEDIERMFDDIDSLIKDEDDSFVCCILSHGSENTIYASDSEGVVLRTEENSLEIKLAKCGRLERKPKLFFISTCRKPKKAESDGSAHALESDCDVLHTRADFIFNYATLRGEESWRYTDTGTSYISKLCQILCENATKATLSDIQKRVAQVVGKMEMHQLPTLEEQTTRNVYFFDDFF